MDVCDVHEVSSVGATTADGVVFAGLGVAVGCVDSPPSLIVPSLHQTDGGLCKGRWCYMLQDVRFVYY